MTIIHFAAEPVGFVQRCARCGIILIDRTNEMRLVADSQVRWWAGSVAIEPGVQSASANAPTCSVAGSWPQ